MFKFQTHVYCEIGPGVTAIVEVIETFFQICIRPAIAKLHLLKEFNWPFCFVGGSLNSKIPMRRPLQLLQVSSMNCISKPRWIGPWQRGILWGTKWVMRKFSDANPGHSAYSRHECVSFKGLCAAKGCFPSSKSKAATLVQIFT